MSSLAHTTIGDGANPIVFVHGFTQTGAAWKTIAHELSSRLPDVRCLLVDLPGHGDSVALSADLPETAALLASLGGEATYVGYSLGGRVITQLLADRPSVVRSAVLISATAGIDDEVERERRTHADAALADRIVAIGVDAFLEEWLAQPMFSGLSPDRSLLNDRRRNTAAGLADSLRRSSQGRQQPLWQALATSRVPVLAIAGARDIKYVALARRIATLLPRGTLRIMPECGHSVPWERPSLLSEVLYDWMTSPTE